MTPGGARKRPRATQRMVRGIASMSLHRCPWAFGYGEGLISSKSRTGAQKKSRPGDRTALAANAAECELDVGSLEGPMARLIGFFAVAIFLVGPVQRGAVPQGLLNLSTGNAKVWAYLRRIAHSK